MMTRFRLVANLSPAFLVLALGACGGSKKPATAPSPTDSAAPAASASSAPETPAEASSSEAPAADDSGGDDSSGPKPSQPPIDLMTQTDEAFVVDFKSSDIGDKAEKACKSDNPAKAAKCEKGKRNKFVADVMQFKKKDDKYTFTIYKRRGKRVTKLSSNEVKLTQKSDNTVTVETLDKNMGPRVLFSGARKFNVTVPNDYSIEIKDPKYGKLVYQGKVDILGGK